MSTTTKPPGTYADLLADITALQDIADTRKKELIAAARFMAEKVIALGIAAPIDIAMLNSKLASISATTFGLKRASLQNIKSRFRSALKLTGREVMPGKHTTALTPEWQAVMTLIPTKKRARPISRLAHFASERGWSPSEIDDEKMALFEIGLKSAITPHAAGVYRRTCKALNDFAATVTGWPVSPVTMPLTTKAPKSLPWAKPPKHLTAEADALFAKKLAVVGKTPSLSTFENIEAFTTATAGGSGNRWAAATVSNYRYALRRHLSALVELGLIDTFTDLRSTLKPDAVMRTLRHMIGAGDLLQIHFRIAAALTAIGANIGLSESELSALRSLEMHVYEELGGSTRGLSDKNNRVLAALSDPKNQAALLALPFTLAKLAKSGSVEKGVHAARMMRTAVALEILIMATVRMKTLIELRLDQHFLNLSYPTAENLQVLIPAAQTKGKTTPIAFELPADSSALIRDYIATYRPLLPGSGTGWLFAGTKDSHLDKSTLAEQVTKAVLDHVGVAMHRHAFRHNAAKILLDAYPTAYQTVSTVLSHGSIDTTVKHYAGVDQTKAVKVLDDLVAQIRTKKRRKKK